MLKDVKGGVKMGRGSSKIGKNKNNWCNKKWYDR